MGSEQKNVEKIGIRTAARHVFLCCDQTKPKCCDRKRAVAAFANALSLRPSWSARIARNLADAERR